MYLYREVDSQGNPLEFLLSTTCDAQAAKRFFLKALHFTTRSDSQAHSVEEQLAHPPVAAPGGINVDKNAAYPRVIADLKAAGKLSVSVELRQVKDLNNFFEQAHRFIKWLVKLRRSFFSIETAERSLQG